MFHEERKAQLLSSSFDIRLAACQDVFGGSDALGPASEFHRLTRGLVEFRRRPGEGDTMFFQCLHDLDARDALVRGAIAEIEKEIEALPDTSSDLFDGCRLLEILHLPLGAGKKGPWIAGPVVGGKGIGEKILVGQKADAHRSAETLSSSHSVSVAAESRPICQEDHTLRL